MVNDEDIFPNIYQDQQLNIINNSIYEKHKVILLW